MPDSVLHNLKSGPSLNFTPAQCVGCTMQYSSGPEISVIKGRERNKGILAGGSVLFSPTYLMQPLCKAWTQSRFLTSCCACVGQCNADHTFTTHYWQTLPSLTLLLNPTLLARIVRQIWRNIASVAQRWLALALDIWAFNDPKRILRALCLSAVEILGVYEKSLGVISFFTFMASLCFRCNLIGLNTPCCVSTNE